MKLYYFEPDEFTRGGVDWFAKMDPRLLVLLDVFRHLWGAAVEISPHPAALGRRAGTTRSDHNVDLHGAVRAADVMPEGMLTRTDVSRAVRFATMVGFTAIGVYPDWKPSPGLHLGVRDSRIPGAPATWGAVRPDPSEAQVYVSLDEAAGTLA